MPGFDVEVNEGARMALRGFMLVNVQKWRFDEGTQKRQAD
jgi:hypothetical protein